MKYILLFAWLCSVGIGNTQSLEQQLKTAYAKFEADSQLRHAISSLHVIDAATGSVVFSRNADLGLAPASTQKIITAATAFELLGPSYQYETQLVVDRTDNRKILFLVAGGDPTLGSWRWKQTNEFALKKRLVESIRAAGISKIDHLYIQTGGWEQTVPDRWIWQDIGNYYGAGPAGLIWRENQYDILMKSAANTGGKVELVRTIPALHDVKFDMQVLAGAKGSGDNAWVYYPLNSDKVLVKGTIPPGESSFKISAALPDAGREMLHHLVDTLQTLGIHVTSLEPPSFNASEHARTLSVIHKERSPALDSIIYWFNRKSINLYGEALLSTMALVKTGVPLPDSGISLVQKFWKERNIAPQELNIYDGSGLSPMNRVTTHSQVEVLRFARGRDWFPAFFASLPEYNNMKMKSGTIGDVKGFCGYHTSSNGKTYIFSFLVNNYSGGTGQLVRKMYEVLDRLK